MRVHVLIQGRVQGVGFRFSTSHQAQNRGLTGWVRNCSDGSVEAEFQGAPEVVEDMIAWCRRGPSTASVTSVNIESQDDVTGEEGFRVRG